MEEPFDPERSFFYPLQLDLDLYRDLEDDDSFDVDEGEVWFVAFAVMTAFWCAGSQVQ